jgi:hypothetical protein
MLDALTNTIGAEFEHRYIDREARASETEARQRAAETQLDRRDKLITIQEQLWQGTRTRLAIGWGTAGVVVATAANVAL